jgi:rRNA pseudouridine-1189 N-methylase Emg1 (Nep1/Mra1 family)
MTDPTYHESPLLALFDRTIADMSQQELSLHITSLKEVRANPVKLRMSLLDEEDHAKAIAKKTVRKRKAPPDISSFV